MHHFDTKQKIIFFSTIVIASFLLLQHTHTSAHELDHVHESLAAAHDCTDQSHTTITVRIEDKQFTPQKIDAKLCDKLVFTNLSNRDRKPAAGKHPTHIHYPGFEPEQSIPPGGRSEVTLVVPGEFVFHDHYEQKLTGTLSVSE